MASARQAVGLLRRNHQRGLIRLVAAEVVVDADAPEIPVGIDGEAILIATPDMDVATRSLLINLRDGAPAGSLVCRQRTPPHRLSGRAGRQFAPRLQ